MKIYFLLNFWRCGNFFQDIENCCDFHFLRKCNLFSLFPEKCRIQISSHVSKLIFIILFEHHNSIILTPFETNSSETWKSKLLLPMQIQARGNWMKIFYVEISRIGIKFLILKLKSELKFVQFFTSFKINEKEKRKIGIAKVIVKFRNPNNTFMRREIEKLQKLKHEIKSMFWVKSQRTISIEICIFNHSKMGK